MAHCFRRLIAVAALASALAFLPAATLSAGENAAPAGPGQRPWQQRPPMKPPLGADHSPEMQNVRRALEGLTPEQRKRFGENLMRWSNLSPEEKKALREGEALRQKYIEQEINMAINASGLRLEGQRREQFVKRFTEERRKIEEQLRHEMMEKRKPLVRELVDRLKVEFADPKR
jgi:Spy/CpxP family protein refolding chaperone